VDARRAAREQLGALERRVGDAEVDDRLGIVLARVERVEQGRGYRRAAHRREALYLLRVRDRHDARHDRDVYPGGARVLDEAEVRLVVEE